MNQLLTLILLSLIITTKAQNNIDEHFRFDTFLKTTTGYYNRGLYYKAVETIDSLNNNKFIGKWELFFFARVYSLNNQFDKTLFHLEKAVKKGITKHQVETMYDLDNFRQSHLYMLFNLNYEKWNNTYLETIKNTSIDSVYYKEIIAMYQASLKARKYKVTYVDGDEIYEKYEVGDSLKIWKAEIKQDSINFEELANLIKIKGFPTVKRVGSAFETIVYMLKYKSQAIEQFETPNSVWTKIIPAIQTEMESGNLPPYFLAYLEDLYRNSKKLPQTYLTFSKSSYCERTTNCIEAPENLNVRRKAVGLCSIELEYWTNAEDFPEVVKNLMYNK